MQASVRNLHICESSLRRAPCLSGDLYAIAANARGCGDCGRVSSRMVATLLPWFLITGALEGVFMEASTKVGDENVATDSADESKKSGLAKTKGFVAYIPGILFLVLGVVMLTTETPSVTTAFGADFYTEVYRAAADIAVVCKFGFGFILIGLGVDRICRALSHGGSL